MTYLIYIFLHHSDRLQTSFCPQAIPDLKEYGGGHGVPTVTASVRGSGAYLCTQVAVDEDVGTLEVPVDYRRLA